MQEQSALALVVATILSLAYFAPAFDTVLPHSQQAAVYGALPTPQYGVPSCTISSPPGQIQAGTNVRLIWVPVNADRATITEIGSVNPRQTGSQTVYVTANKLYTMSVWNGVNMRTCSALILVQRQPAPQNYVLQQYPSTQYVAFPQTQTIYTSPIVIPTVTTPSYNYVYPAYTSSYWYTSYAPRSSNSYYSDYGYSSGGGDTTISCGPGRVRDGYGGCMYADGYGSSGYGYSSKSDPAYDVCNDPGMLSDGSGGCYQVNKNNPIYDVCNDPGMATDGKGGCYEINQNNPRYDPCSQSGYVSDGQGGCFSSSQQNSQNNSQSSSNYGPYEDVLPESGGSSKDTNRDNYDDTI